MIKKPFAKKDGAKVLIATAIGFALIFGFTTNSLKLRDKPPSWKVMNGGYSAQWQFKFGKSSKVTTFSDDGNNIVWVLQRNSFGPISYSRLLVSAYSTLSKPEKRKLDRDKLFAELN